MEESFSNFPKKRETSKGDKILNKPMVEPFKTDVLNKPMIEPYENNLLEKGSIKRYPYDKNNPIVDRGIVNITLDRPPVGGRIEKIPLEEVHVKQIEGAQNYVKDMGLEDALSVIYQGYTTTRKLNLNNDGAGFDHRTLLLNAVNRVGLKIKDGQPVGDLDTISLEEWQSALDAELEIFINEVEAGYHDSKHTALEEIEGLYIYDESLKEELLDKIVKGMYRRREDLSRLDSTLRRAVAIMKNDKMIQKVLEGGNFSKIEVIQGLMQIFLEDTGGEVSDFTGDPSLKKRLKTHLENEMMVALQDGSQLNKPIKLNDGSITYELPRYAW